MRKVESGNYVRVHYTGKLDDGEVFDSSRDGQPIEVQAGAEQVIKGFDDAILGMALEEKKTFTLAPEEAYGHRDENLERTFERSDLPDGMDPREGEIIALKTDDGEQIPARVKNVDEKKLTLDLNHPLAGESLTFDIEIMEINDHPTACPSGCNC